MNRVVFVLENSSSNNLEILSCMMMELNGIMHRAPETIREIEHETDFSDPDNRGSSDVIRGFSS